MMRRMAVFSLLLLSAMARADPIAGAPWLEAYPHSHLYSSEDAATAEYLLGLGAFQKIGGRWRHKYSEHIKGELSRYTWQVDDGFSSEEAFTWFLEQLPEAGSLLYECSGRSCGSSAQWADRVFGERVLYGHDERQRYAAFRLQRDGNLYTLVLYASDRANRRHFLRLDVVKQEIP